MRSFFAVFVFVTLFSTICVSAQNPDDSDALVDSLVYIQATAFDQSLAGKSIFNVLSSSSSDVSIHQSQAIASAFEAKVSKNKTKVIGGFRVRIYFDNKQDSRNLSEASLKRFCSNYPGYGAYRTFSSPFFKVSVGDFRTKSEAIQLMQLIKDDFPSATLVKESINYPVVDREHSYLVDTVKVRRSNQ